ncbi:DUF2510 domain-containing protein [Microbacterium hominis]|uniref:DUF2510 domain-containing protein n=1 Tax=Microbacterium hominis TaxID=162426 RepID=A0A7D4TID4_9MICO|nr:DUF2510 domain-containing protein [Microbacterium hominis]QKJ20701.1 DUF2510 domain-containing protein [Microbacterium hominis]
MSDNNSSGAPERRSTHLEPEAPAEVVPPLTPPAGWYPDPHAPSAQRYWDGAQWTEHVAPAVTPGVGAAVGDEAAPMDAGPVIAAGAVPARRSVRKVRWWQRIGRRRPR